MIRPQTIHLDLRAPLEYEQMPGLDPFASQPPPSIEEAAPETLFCFELDKEQAWRIDPQSEHFLGELLFSGISGTQKNGQGNVRLATGLYLFTQQRAALNRKDCIDMAIEQQKDGLWERLRPENRLYIRRLYEDGSPVTQIFRPYRP